MVDKHDAGYDARGTFPGSAVTTCSGINNKSLQWDKQWIFAMSLGLCSCVGWVKNV